MAHLPAADAAIGVHDHGLRFLNEEWNDSISNGHPFTLKWNQSLVKADSQLGLFKIRYPEEGVVVYDLVSNLTDSIGSASCEWTPEHLGNDLYAVWLSTGQHAHPNWTLSPPWTPKKEEVCSLPPPHLSIIQLLGACVLAQTSASCTHVISVLDMFHYITSAIFVSLTRVLLKSNNRLHWAAPIIIPVVCLLVLYAICLSIYLMYRRRKREKREKEDATPHQDVSRNNSVDSAITVQTFTEPDDGIKSKPSIWLITHPSVEADITTQGLQKEGDTAHTPTSPADTLVAQSPV
ncbi:hypothetical protein QQS21_008356 [Conoideocrella luteorostrata]|uniref:Uncharacterized protein n=1 Tax=Conoideocrella luteorostrata TaxID=1105319 RepID=A0AAJ0CJ76_9HYPO|nr:hypothetical protein QQS21_008356 [Conoideocrella luteorostrata]